MIGNGPPRTVPCIEHNPKRLSHPVFRLAFGTLARTGYSHPTPRHHADNTCRRLIQSFRKQTVRAWLRPNLLHVPFEEFWLQQNAPDSPYLFQVGGAPFQVSGIHLRLPSPKPRLRALTNKKTAAQETTWAQHTFILRRVQFTIELVTAENLPRTLLVFVFFVSYRSSSVQPLLLISCMTRYKPATTVPCSLRGLPSPRTLYAQSDTRA